MLCHCELLRRCRVSGRVANGIETLPGVYSAYNGFVLRLALAALFPSLVGLPTT
jgi:hypothetical protein